MRCGGICCLMVCRFESGDVEGQVPIWWALEVSFGNAAVTAI